TCLFRIASPIMTGDDLALTGTTISQGSGSSAGETDAVRLQQIARSLETGKTYAAVAATRAHGDTNEEGVILRSVFIPLEHRAELREGQSVNVRVIATEPELLIEYAGERSEATVS